MTATQSRCLTDWQSNDPARILAALRAVGMEDDARLRVWCEQLRRLWEKKRGALSERLNTEQWLHYFRYTSLCSITVTEASAFLRCLFGDVFAGGVKTCPGCLGQTMRIKQYHRGHEFMGFETQRVKVPCATCHGTGFILTPLVIDPRWRTGDVLALAKAVRGGQRANGIVGAIGGKYQPCPDRLPILHDALMDSGCDNEAILEHCREPGPHVGGCWVVRMLLEAAK